VLGPEMGRIESRKEETVESLLVKVMLQLTVSPWTT